jgi:hypothetical protein
MRYWTTFVSFSRKRAINSSSNSRISSKNRFVSSHLCRFAKSVEIRRKFKINKSALSVMKFSISRKKLSIWKRTNSMSNLERHDFKFVEKLSKNLRQQYRLKNSKRRKKHTSCQRFCNSNLTIIHQFFQISSRTHQISRTNSSCFRSQNRKIQSRKKMTSW